MKVINFCKTDGLSQKFQQGVSQVQDLPGQLRETLS